MNIRKAIAGIAVAGALSAGFAGVAGAATVKDDGHNATHQQVTCDTLKDRLAKLHARIDKVKDRIAKMEARVDQLRKEGHEDQAEALQHRIEAARDRLTKLEARVQKVEARVDARCGK